ncbi:type I secretion system permease/ATPase [Sphingomonas sp.]|uniref:type I secretion system permease/ATPase n=1 Tax=Sphingomonas sp. TaxID=28214 RepID=UPI000DB85B19|nr:type I secretion system permease/ATPase [Sphingomonas sp.]PZU06202.1 MAG: type I secretion system permease/ATPase [Sphingomonas sp.]
MLKLGSTSHTADDAADPIGRVIRACRRYFVHGAAFSAFLNLLYLAPTIYMLQVYDRVMPTRGAMTLTMLTLILSAAVLTIALLDLVRTRLLVRASARLDRELAGPILDAMLRLAGTGGSARTTSAMRDFDAFRSTMTGAGVLALFDLPWAPIYVLVCFLLHPALAGLAVGGAVVLSVLSWLNERATADPIRQASQSAQVSHSGIESILSASGVIGSLGMRPAMIRRHLAERHVATRLALGATFRSSGYTSAIKAIRLLLQSLALGLGALLAIEGKVSVGSLFAASLLVSRALQPIELVNGAWKNLIQARAAYRSLVDLFAARGTIRQTTQLPDPAGALAVEGVRVMVPGSDRALLQGIRFQLEAGESLGIIGPSGAGKSTLARVIAGALPPSEGCVRIDGAALEDWPEQQIGGLIGYVPQAATLFRGTIKENIARFQTEFAEPGALDAEVVRAAQLCGAHEFILRLPNAYDTQLGWGGAGLSVGQAQRIALARAMFGGPAVLVLDEPNASLDSESEAQLIAALDELRGKGVTMIIVAHRMNVLASVDKMLFLRDGRAELFGPRNAVFARLAGRASTDTAPAAPAAAQAS